jgi:anaerobic magnesium-protoporphyrin IX monomethyl ester cyclase
VKRNLDLLMVFPGGGDFYDPKFKNVLGSAYILAFLRENGIIANQFISDEFLNVHECVLKILRFKPKIVGFTVYNSNVIQSLLIAKALKLTNPKLIIIFGGPTPTVQAEDILRDYEYVDICVRGEGEEVLLELINLLALHEYVMQNAPLEVIHGISYRNQNELTSCPDSNVLYSHRYEAYYLDKYPSPHLISIIPIQDSLHLGIITGRGCNQNCIYCNCATLSKRNVYFHSIDRVIEELVYINQVENIKIPIPINDDTFTIVPKRAKKICERIIDQDIKVPLGCITRADKIDKELLDLMKLAGFKSIGFSLESSVPRVLRTIGKVCPPEKKDDLGYDKEKSFILNVERMVSHAKEIGMTVYISTLIGSPGESLKDAKETINTVRRLDPDFYTHNYLHLYKGTPIYENRVKYGYEVQPIGKFNKFFTTNSYPFDVYKVKLDPKATDLHNSKVIDYKALQTFSLTPMKGIQQDFFIKAIINSDKLTPEMVSWLQNNLVINGSIYHIYSNQRQYEALYLKNEETLFDMLSPTQFYEHYYWENKKLKSGRMAKLGGYAGMSIEFKDITTSLSEYLGETKDLRNVITQNENIKDVEEFLKFFDEINIQKEPFDYLFNKRLNPQFMNLCSWTTNKANCIFMEIAILSERGIQLCWNFEPIADLSLNFSQIKRIIELKQSSFENQMNCHSCSKNDDCIKCLYPYPMDHKQFCKYSSNRNKKAGNVLYSFNAIKELLFKPISVYDY